MNLFLQKKIQSFLEWGQQMVVRQDRGALSNLRRGFSRGTENRCWPYIAPYCDLTRDKERIIWTTIAAGFAIHERSLARGNMGVTMRRLALEGSTGTREDALNSFDARFRRLLSCQNSKEACERLPGIIRAAKNKGNIPIDFERLFEDLWFWGEKVKLSWAQTYWGQNSEDKREPDSK